MYVNKKELFPFVISIKSDLNAAPLKISQKTFISYKQLVSKKLALGT